MKNAHFSQTSPMISLTSILLFDYKCREILHHNRNSQKFKKYIHSSLQDLKNFEELSACDKSWSYHFIIYE